MLDQWKAEATPRREVVAVCFDGRLLSDLEAAEKKRDELRGVEGKMLGNPEFEAAEARVEELRGEVEAKTHVFAFDSIGQKAWADLVSDHPPTPEEKKANADLDIHPATFFPAALAATGKEIGADGTETPFDLEQGEFLVAELPEPEVLRLTMACTKVNRFGGRELPLPNGFAGRHPSKRTSKPRSPSGSPAPSS
jgi:hypothetical protein